MVPIQIGRGCNMLSNIDYLSGEVRWSDESLQEDILLVEYPNNYHLDLGWYIDVFIIYIVKDEEWRVPVVKYIISDKSKVRETLIQAVKRIEEESQNARSHYGTLWKTETIHID